MRLECLQNAIDACSQRLIGNVRHQRTHIGGTLHIPNQILARSGVREVFECEIQLGQPLAKVTRKRRTYAAVLQQGAFEIGNDAQPVVNPIVIDATITLPGQRPHNSWRPRKTRCFKVQQPCDLEISPCGLLD